MFVLFTEKIVACCCIVFTIIFKAVKEVLLRVSKFVFNLAHYEIIDLFLIVWRLVTPNLATDKQIWIRNIILFLADRPIFRILIFGISRRLGSFLIALLSIWGSCWGFSDNRRCFADLLGWGSHEANLAQAVEVNDRLCLDCHPGAVPFLVRHQACLTNRWCMGCYGDPELAALLTSLLAKLNWGFSRCRGMRDLRNIKGLFLVLAVCYGRCFALRLRISFLSHRLIISWFARFRWGQLFFCVHADHDSIVDLSIVIEFVLTVSLTNTIIEFYYVFTFDRCIL